MKCCLRAAVKPGLARFGGPLFPLALPILSAGPGPGVDDIVFSALLFPVSPAAASIVA